VIAKSTDVWESADVSAARRVYGVTRVATQRQITVAFERAAARMLRANVHPNVVSATISRDLPVLLWCTNWTGPRGGYVS
jgi:hypothetical protein